MDQNDTPLLDALRAIERRPLSGFGAPGHSQGGAIPSGLKRLLGRRVFEADVLTPKGLDDRTEGKLALQRAHEIAAEAWGADFCRYVTGGSTQSLHSVLAAVAGPGDTLLVAQNAHKAEWSYALAAGIDLAVLPVAYDADWDIELGVRPETLAAALDRHPEAKAAVVVSPNYYGVTSDVPALAALCHARGIPLIVDAAWGGAFAFSPALPVDALAAGADAQVCSLHKTMGALAQGSVILARGDLLDRQRLWMAYELFETTSPSVPILASLEATRRDHAVDGEKLWADVLSLATAARASIAAIDGLRVYSRNDLPAGADLDETKILVDVGALGVGYAIDDWLYANHRVSVGLSDAPPADGDRVGHAAARRARAGQGTPRARRDARRRPGRAAEAASRPAARRLAPLRAGDAGPTRLRRSGGDGAVGGGGGPDRRGDDRSCPAGRAAAGARTAYHGRPRRVPRRQPARRRVRPRPRRSDRRDSPRGRVVAAPPTWGAGKLCCRVPGALPPRGPA